MSTVELYFAGDPDWTDVSHLVRYKSQVKNVRLMSRDRRSVIDSFSFALKYDQVVFDKLYAAGDRILAKVSDGATAIFAGYIAPTFDQRIAQVAESISLEILDNSFLLDDEISESFAYPATVGGTPYKILDQSDTANSIVHQLLQMAGYTIPDDIAASCPDVLFTVLHVAGTAAERTYREFLDALLFEYGFVLYFDATGRFSVYFWDRDTVPPLLTIDAVGTEAGCRVEKSDNPYDGFKVEWAETKTLTGALLYRENLPVEAGSGEAVFPGEPIAAGDYFPADGDIKDLFQDFRTQWLDIPYLARLRRLENEDISLIASSDHVVNFSADTDVVIDTQNFEAKRARVLFHNTGGVTERIYTFEIEGTVLFRNARRYALSPSSAKKPEEYTAEFVFAGDRAARLARSMEIARTYGDFVYSFSDRQEIDTGTVVNLVQAKANINANVIIIEAQKNLDLPMWDYVAVGVTAYSAGTVAATGGSSEVLATRLAKIETQLAVRPTFEAVAKDGWNAGTGTTTPTPPTVSVCESRFNFVLLKWDSQNELTNFSHYELQCQENGDGANWYAIAQDGTGKGTLGAVTTVHDTFFVHQNIPYDGTVDAPTAVTYNYRVRRVTKASVSSSYSATASATTAPISTADLAVDTVTSAKLLDDAVTNSKIADGAVDTLQLAAAAVEESKIAVAAVTTTKIADGAVDTLQLAAAAVEEATIAANAVTSGKLSAASVIAGKIAAGTIVAADIAAGTITGAKIAAGTITGTNIAATTITAANIAAATITGAKIAAGTITASNILAGTITATQLATDTITANKIAAGAIGTSELAALAVTADKIAAGTITAAKIATGTLTAAQMTSGIINSLLAEVNTLLAVDAGNGFLASEAAVSGNERIYMDADELVFQRHNGTSWVDRIRLGNVDGAGADFKSKFEERITVVGHNGLVSGGTPLYHAMVVVDAQDYGDIQILTGNSGTGALIFGDTAASQQGWVAYGHSIDTLVFGAGGGIKLSVNITNATFGTHVIPALSSYNIGSSAARWSMGYFGGLDVSGEVTVSGQLTVFGGSRIAAGRSVVQSIPNTTNTRVIFNTEEFDNLGEYNAGTGVFTAQAAGLYLVTWQVFSSSVSWAANKYWITYLLKNGSAVAQGFYANTLATGAGYLMSHGSKLLSIAAGDTIEIEVRHSQGAAVNIYASTQYTCLNIIRIQ